MRAAAPPRTYGWDTSHYDGPITGAVARLAYTQGIRFATAKIGEGAAYDDPADGTALANLRAAGMRVLGGYYVVRSTPSPAVQVARCIALADRDEPWWRDFPGWFWQVDLERWPTDSVKPAQGIAFGDQLRAVTGRGVLMYASHGQYGDSLAAWDGDLWNANYRTNRQAPFADLYPGDSSPGWDAYSGRVPAILQYASTATIGGLTTCDANAFRGTVDDLLALIIKGVPDMPVTDADADKIQHANWYTKNLPSGTPTMTPATALLSTYNAAQSIVASQADQTKQLAAVLAALAALATGGTDVDTAAILAAVRDEGAKESTLVTSILTELHDTRAKLAAALAG
jgi:hypothetical protein